MIVARWAGEEGRTWTGWWPGVAAAVAMEGGEGVAKGARRPDGGPHLAARVGLGLRGREKEKALVGYSTQCGPMRLG